MKNSIILLFLTVVVACKQSVTNTDDGESIETLETEIAATETRQIDYPETLDRVFDAHGGMNVWNKQRQLKFSFMGRSGKEVNTISLKDRKSLIENENWTIGFDGEDVWLQQKDSTSYQGNARFYHNLMFYFYAMPFVLGDEGIQYESIQETKLMGDTYAGIKISYQPEVGDSPKDEYILFYNPETYTMEWLAYTVTFGKNEKSDRFSYIKYSAWETTNGVVLPTQLTWYQVQDGKPISARSSMDFESISISETPLSPMVFAKPETAVVVDK